ncbi:hypothetical protein SAMN05444266_102209 [Chitinophaga jiangningensis]|uniref:Uncharacterized protein n=2 Tax=Chitinophaga jiangningensis TaxID=1419482 RepID=A0A1M6Y908_9BACT|nr:hypothetical protein SAMN05444266_102209 [Chitinophaga jiangningensis]
MKILVTKPLIPQLYNMANTGKKQYALLVQYSSTTGLPTGVVKPNVPGDPDYVAPVEDATGCPFIPVQNTHFTINNFTSKEQAGPITYTVSTGVNTATLQATESSAFTESGEDHLVIISGERVGQSWRYAENTITYDAFVFIQGRLTAMGCLAESWEKFVFPELSGEVLINVVSSDRGYYRQAGAVAIQLGSDVGTASFSFIGNDGALVTLDSTNTFGSYDVDYYHPAPDFNGTNSNAYALLMEVTTYDGDSVPVDPDGPDGGWMQLPRITLETIEAGATVSRNLSTEYFGDFFVRITKK